RGSRLEVRGYRFETRASRLEGSRSEVCLSARHPDAPSAGALAVERHAVSVWCPRIFFGRRIVEHAAHLAAREIEQPRAITRELEDNPSSVRRDGGSSQGAPGNRRSIPLRRARANVMHDDAVVLRV